MISINLSFLPLKKSLINTLHPSKGFVKVYTSIAIIDFRPKQRLIVDFETEKFRIEKNQNRWEVNPSKRNSTETESALFNSNEEVCAYFKEVLMCVYRECIEK